ncbi:NADH-quinone oxidoreductase subunit C [Streptomyces sp. DT171]|uniref:NADH-quinone oxidoreductase subunit C n=1 Tax=Streptomyces sp. DT171 TaxID=3416524 RepID=UPI003CEFEAC4
MTAAETYDRLPDAVTEIFGEEATAEHAFDLLTVDVPASAWITALETARTTLDCGYFDWLSAVDEPGTGFRVCAHLAALHGGGVRRLLVRTTVPHEAPTLPSAIGVYAGAAWHERETHEMFGVDFTDHPHLVPLLLPEGFEGHPLRKDFVLAARVAKAWPGAKEPGESEHGGPKRRQMLPPGVPDPNEWGPLKGQLPPAPARPARAARAAGDRPVRRTRSVNEGSSASWPTAESPGPTPGTGGTAAPDGTAPASVPNTPPATAPAPAPAPASAPRRARSASQGSASQRPDSRPAGETPRPADETPRSGTAPEGTSSDAAPKDARAADGTTPAADTSAPGKDAAPEARSADAPWHHARPAFEDTPAPGTAVPGTATSGGAPAPETATPETATSGAPAPEPTSAEPESTESGPTRPKSTEPEPGSTGSEPGSTEPEPDSPSSGSGSAEPDRTEPDRTEPGSTKPSEESGPTASPGPEASVDRPDGGDPA